MNSTLDIISLFSGAGGMDLGFEAEGFRTAVAVEADPVCCRTLRHNRPGWRVLNAPIEELTTEAILEAAGLRPLEAALVIGGPPCQAWSMAGDRAGLDDPKGMLVREFVRVVREALPVGFVMENVPGLVSWNEGEALRLIVMELSKPVLFEGREYRYSVAEPRILNAADYGAPQLRERLFVVGNRVGVDYCYPEATHFQPGGSDFLFGDEKPYATAGEALDGLPEPDGPSATALRVAGAIERGRNASREEGRLEENEENGG